MLFLIITFHYIRVRDFGLQSLSADNTLILTFCFKKSIWNIIEYNYRIHFCIFMRFDVNYFQLSLGLTEPLQLNQNNLANMIVLYTLRV